MDTNAAASITTHLSAVLAILAAQATVVAAFRILQMWQHEEPGGMPRILNLVALLVFMLGSCGREAVVAFAGAVSWGPEAILWSGAARFVQIAGAVLFIWNITRAVCGQWLWSLSLAVAIAVSLVALR